MENVENALEGVTSYEEESEGETRERILND